MKHLDQRRERGTEVRRADLGQGSDRAEGGPSMRGLWNVARHRSAIVKLVAVGALCGGVLSVVAAPVLPAAAFSATPQWFTTGGSSVSSLTCGTWYVTTMGAQ